MGKYTAGLVIFAASMNRKCLVILVFLTSVSLLLASLISREQVEQVRADDYGTYVHRPSASHVASSHYQLVGELPDLLSHHYFISDDLRVCGVAERATDRSFSATIPIYLSLRQILI